MLRRPGLKKYPRQDLNLKLSGRQPQRAPGHGSCRIPPGVEWGQAHLCRAHISSTIATPGTEGGPYSETTKTSRRDIELRTRSRWLVSPAGTDRSCHALQDASQSDIGPRHEAIQQRRVQASVKQPVVHQACVAAKSDSPAGHRLAAYLVMTAPAARDVQRNPNKSAEARVSSDPGVFCTNNRNMSCT